MERKRILTVVAGTLAALALIAAVAYWAGKSGVFAPAPPPVEPLPQEPAVMREVILYFADPLAQYLFPENREIPDCPDNAACVRQVIAALIAGPAAHNLVPVIPPQASVLAVAIAGDTVTVDFSRDLMTRHPGGSISELLTVYGLADTLAVNFPHLRQVRILIAGESVESLRGHVDLRGPIAADFRYTRPPLRPGESPGAVRASQGESR